MRCYLSSRSRLRENTDFDKIFSVRSSSENVFCSSFLGIVFHGHIYDTDMAVSDSYGEGVFMPSPSSGEGGFDEI